MIWVWAIHIYESNQLENCARTHTLSSQTHCYLRIHLQALVLLFTRSKENSFFYLKKKSVANLASASSEHSGRVNASKRIRTFQCTIRAKSVCVCVNEIVYVWKKLSNILLLGRTYLTTKWNRAQLSNWFDLYMFLILFLYADSPPLYVIVKFFVNWLND